MDRKRGSVHYHVRWAQISLLDWESFSTRVAAERSAKELKRFGETCETYTIEKHDENCQRCRDAREAKSATFGT
jgi:hypothetical protein